MYAPVALPHQLEPATEGVSSALGDILERFPSATSLMVAIVLLGLAAVMSALDTALRRVSQSRATELSNMRVRGADQLVEALRDDASTLSVSAMLRVMSEAGVAISISYLTLNSLGADPYSAALAVFLSGAVLYVVVWVSAQTLARSHAEWLALRGGKWLLRLRRFLWPLARLLILVGNATTPGKGYQHGPFDTEAHLRQFVDLAGQSEVIDEDEREMIHSVFDLGETVAREVMVPRTDLKRVSREAALPEAMELFLASGHSRLPVMGEDSDDIVGILYFKDLAKQMHYRRQEAPALQVDRVMREAWFVPDTVKVDKLMRDMQKRRQHAALVVDEYGGIAGLVTMEDLLEEIVGELADEHDVEENPLSEKLDDDRFLVSARLHVEELGELFNLPLEDDEVDTVGGLLAKALGSVPVMGSNAEIYGLRLTADAMGGRRRVVERVLVERVHDTEKPEKSHHTGEVPAVHDGHGADA